MLLQPRWPKTKVCREGLLSGQQILLEGNTLFLQASVCLQATNILYVCVYIYSFLFFQSRSLDNPSSANNWELPAFQGLSLLFELFFFLLPVACSGWGEACSLYGSALALRRIKELVFGYLSQGDFSGDQILCRKRGRGEEKGLNLDNPRSWNRSCNEDCITHSNMISCCIFKNNHLPCLFSVFFSTLCSTAEYHAMWTTALGLSWNNGENSASNVLHSFLADDLYGPFLPHHMELKGARRKALTS